MLSRCKEEQMNTRSRLGSSGKLTTRIIHAKGPGLLWKLSNLRRLVIPWLKIKLAKVFHVPTFYGSLRAVLKKGDGSVINYGLVSLKLVTTAFVEYMVDEMITETSAWGDFQFHDSGVGVTPANVADTDIETTDNEARTNGTQVEGVTGEIYVSVGEITYSGALAITEHGLFNIAAGGILLDHHVFSAINVENTDSIEFTYNYTIDDGG